MSRRAYRMAPILLFKNSAKKSSREPPQVFQTKCCYPV